ncbi:hypothetical protein GCM10025857_16490 [Alicyclobacillus contaminans]|nr:hypothetical protein GCM10025857_16490 [Alicyclobacillus contaminans]
MLPKAKLDRINALARKQKQTGLTPSEVEEQKALRMEYLAAFRKAFREQLEQIEWVDDADTPTKPPLQ